MLNWFTYLGVFIAKTYLGAFVLFVVGAPSLHLLREKSIPSWEQYFSSFTSLFKCLAQAKTNYMWPFILLSFPIGFLACEVLHWFNNWVGLHDELSIFESSKDPDRNQTLEEHFLTTIFIQSHEHIHRIYHWESFQFNLFYCTEFAFEFFLVFHSIASLAIGIAGALSPNITLDLRNTIPVVIVLIIAFLMYLAARRARKEKFIAFRTVYDAIRKYKIDKDHKRTESNEQ